MIGVGATLVLIGALLLFLQNGLLFGSFLLWLADPHMGVHVGSSSLYIDLPGMVLIGTGILAMRTTTDIREDRRDYGRICGILILGWVVATLVWRWCIPLYLNTSYIDVLNGILDSDYADGNSLSRDAHLVYLMLVAWITSSILLLAGVLILRLRGPALMIAALLERRPDLKSWEGFAALNAVGTVLLAGELLTMVNGGDGSGLLNAGLLVKVVIVPVNGAAAYALLAYRTRKGFSTLSGRSSKPDQLSGPL